MISTVKNWINSNNLALIIISIYFLLSIIKLPHPGVNNDQLMFVNAATFIPDSLFLWKSFHGIPTMVFPYIGALKSYFYMPIFYFFGVNIWSIRLPQIILISISLFFIYKTLIYFFNKKIALLTILFLGLDPSLIAYSRVDNGPTVVEFFLKVLTVYLFSLFLSTKKIIFLFIIYTVLGLGVFNKINFIWFLNAFFLSFLILYGCSLSEKFKNIDKFLQLILIAVPYYLLFRFFIKLSRETALSYKHFANEISISNIFNNFANFFKSLINILNGNLFFNMVYGYNPTIFGDYFSILVLLILFVSLVFIIIKHKSLNKAFLKPYFFFVLITLLITLQILLTKRATSAWHTLAISPFFTVVFAIGIFQIYNLIKLQKIRILLVSLVVVIIFYQLAVNILYLEKYSLPVKSIAWSSSIYDLIDFAKITQVKFICLDVDICNQLISLTQQSGKYQESFFYLDPQTYEYSFIKLNDAYQNSDKYLYIAHGETNSHFPELKKKFFKYLEDRKINFTKVKEFKDGDVIAFEIYRIGNSN